MFDRHKNHNLLDRVKCFLDLMREKRFEVVEEIEDADVMFVCETLLDRHIRCSKLERF